MFFAGHFHHRQHGRAEELVDVQKLAQAGRFGVDHVVGQHHGEGLVAHQFRGAQHGMAQPQRLLLADIGDVDHVRDAADDRQQVLLAARFQQVFQLEADVEMIFDGGFAAAGDDDDVLNARVERLLHAVLDNGLVHDGQHLFGLGLGGGKEAGAKPGGWENCFSNFGWHLLQFGRAGAGNSWQLANLCFAGPAVISIMYLGKQPMAYVIAEPCIGTKDTACVDACPVDCIHPKKDEAELRRRRDALHRPGGMHRLRRMRPGLPRIGDFRARRSAGKVGEFTPRTRPITAVRLRHAPPAPSTYGR